MLKCGVVKILDQAYIKGKGYLSQRVLA